MKEKCWVVEASKVIIIKYDDGKRAYGNTVYTKGLKTGRVLMFAHLDSIDVKMGQYLEAGGIIGDIGSTGYSPSGAHLHTSLFPVGCKAYFAQNAVDPKEYFIQYGHPCRTIMTNPFGSQHYNTTEKDESTGKSKLTQHEGMDFSSFRLRAEFKGM